MKHNFSNQLIIKDVLIPYKNTIANKDILIENGKIIEISDKIRKNISQKVIYGKKFYLFPGFIDIHTHLNCKIGNYYVADTYETGTKIAIDNGITTLFNFITQTTNEDAKNTIANEVELLKKQEYYCNVYFHFTPFKDNHIEILKNTNGHLIKTVKLYTTYKNAGLYYSYDDIKKIFKELKDKNFTFLIHCEDEEQLQKDLLEVVEFSKPYSHAIARSKQAEIIAVRNILKLAKMYNQKVHFVHISTPQAAKEIYQAKQEGLNVSCETCPQYLVLNDELLKSEGGYKYICSPPIRSRNLVKKNIELLKTGYFDVLATDHCPFFKKDKCNWNNDFRSIPNGLPGIGALPHVIFNLIDDYSEENILLAYRMLCENPAKVTNIYPHKGVIEVGADADFVCFSLRKSPFMKIKSTYQDCYDPYENMNTKLSIKFVILNGEIVIKYGA